VPQSEQLKSLAMSLAADLPPAAMEEIGTGVFANLQLFVMHFVEYDILHLSFSLSLSLSLCLCLCLCWYLISFIHTAGGVPYWGAIMLASLGVRMLVMPATIASTRNSTRFLWAQPELKKLQAAVSHSSFSYMYLYEIIDAR